MPASSKSRNTIWLVAHALTHGSLACMLCLDTLHVLSWCPDISDSTLMMLRRLSALLSHFPSSTQTMAQLLQATIRALTALSRSQAMSTATKTALTQVPACRLSPGRILVEPYIACILVKLPAH